jgi:hypothetical protein
VVATIETVSKKLIQDKVPTLGSNWGKLNGELLAWLAGTV